MCKASLGSETLTNIPSTKGPKLPSLDELTSAVFAFITSELFFARAHSKVEHESNDRNAV
jgi:hypothetical protein